MILVLRDWINIFDFIIVTFTAGAKRMRALTNIIRNAAHFSNHGWRNYTCFICNLK